MHSHSFRKEVWHNEIWTCWKGENKCEYCLKIGHTKDRCWKLHGRSTPQNRGLGWRSGSSRLHANLPDSSENILISEDSEVNSLSIEEIQARLGQLETSTKNASSATASSHFGITSNASGITNSSCWIIDSGAIDHMIGLTHYSHPILHVWVETKLELLMVQYHSYPGGFYLDNSSLNLSSVLYGPSFSRTYYP